MMPDEDEKNLASMPASDSVPPADDASTVVTEFPQHLIDALEQSAGLPPRQVPPPQQQVPPPVSPTAPPPSPISPMATVEMPAVLLDTIEVSGLPPSSKNPTVVRPPFTTLTQHDAPTPAMGSPSYPADQLDPEPAPVSVEPDEIDLQLDAYESPISVDVVPPSASPAQAPGPTPPTPIPPPSASAANLGAPNVEPPAPSFTFAPQRPPTYPAKPAMAWAEPPPPILMDPPTSAIGWAIGGIVVGLLLLGLVVWLVILAVRHFM